MPRAIRSPRTRTAYGRILQSVGQGSDLGRRYIDTLKTQEDRLAEIDRNNTRIEADIAAERLAAEDLARRLVL